MAAFQFTPPVWGATNYLEKNDRAEEISIHAPRMGSDCIPHNLNRDVNYFNSRSPHGERSGFCIFSVTALFFQFSLPAWRATLGMYEFIHIELVFNSRSPHGERLLYFSVTNSSVDFQFSLPAWRATKPSKPRNLKPKVFNSRSPHGERLHDALVEHQMAIFQFSLPAWRATNKQQKTSFFSHFSILAPRMESDGGRIFL